MLMSGRVCRPTAFVAMLLLGNAQLSSQDTGAHRAGVCLREGHRLVGVRPVEARQGPYRRGSKERSQPDFPPHPPGSATDGSWIGEVLIDTNGKVAKVWTIRGEPWTPAFRVFERTIVEAVMRWDVEPVVRDGKVTPACVTLVRFVN